MSDIYAQIDEDSARNECLHENGQGSKYEENERNLRRDPRSQNWELGKIGI